MNLDITTRAGEIKVFEYELLQFIHISNIKAPYRNGSEEFQVLGNTLMEMILMWGF